jgi:uncharacterized protein YeaO (DUF488 family)
VAEIKHKGGVHVTMTIRIKRAYDVPDDKDGRWILVDRLWPRGISKEKAKIDYWPKELAPSNELRRWYGHDHERWAEFKKRYFSELDANPEQIEEFLKYVRKGDVTFVYSSTEQHLNNAVALKEYIKARL